MTPEEVPAELVDLGYAAMLDAGYRVVEDMGDQVPEDQAVRLVLAAVLPEFGATVLDEEVRTDRYDRPCEDRLLDAAERLRGTTEGPTP